MEDGRLINPGTNWARHNYNLTMSTYQKLDQQIYKMYKNADKE